MKELLNYILTNILPNKDFTIEEEVEGDRIDLTIKTIPDNMGLIIGKGGKTIKSIRNILKIKAVLDKKSVNVNVSEEGQSSN